jgi:hypothetical protein
LRSAAIFFLNKYTLIWHPAFAPCAQLFAFSTRFWVRSTLYALCLKFALCARLFAVIWHHVFGPWAQLVAFSPRFRCALRFTPWAQLLWNPPHVFLELNNFCVRFFATTETN